MLAHPLNPRRTSVHRLLDPRAFGSEISCLRIVNVLIGKYLTELGLVNMYNKIPSAWHRPQKTKEEFDIRFESYTRACSSVFNEHLLVSYFLCDLLPMTAAVVAARVQWFPRRDRVNFSFVWRLAQAEETTYRAQDDARRR